MQKGNEDLPEDLDIELSADSMDAYVSLFGLNDQNIALIEQECNVSVALRHNHLVITGPEKEKQLARQVIVIACNADYRPPLCRRILCVHLVDVRL